MMLFSSDSLTNITSPLDLDSLFYWFAADQGVTDSLGGAIATDEGVGTWADLSGNNYNVTQTTNGARPVYKATGGPGSKPTIQFDGSNDFLASAAHWWGSDDITAFFVLSFASATTTPGEVVFCKDTLTRRQFTFYSAGAAGYRVSFWTSANGSAVQVDNFAAKTTGFKTYSYTVQSAINVSSLRLDAVAQGYGDTNQTQSGVFNSALNQAFVGAGYNGANNLKGSISEIIVYSRALSATERAAIENYLNKKYDLY